MKDNDKQEAKVRGGRSNTDDHIVLVSCQTGMTSGSVNHIDRRAFAASLAYPACVLVSFAVQDIRRTLFGQKGRNGNSRHIVAHDGKRNRLRRE